MLIKNIKYKRKEALQLYIGPTTFVVTAAVRKRTWLTQEMLEASNILCLPVEDNENEGGKTETERSDQTSSLYV